LHKKDIIYIYHIRDSITAIEEFAKDKKLKQFKDNDMLVSAIIRKLEIIGEASKYVSENTKKKFNNIPWRIMTDMRNFLIHGYFGIDVKTIWDTVKKDIPNLKSDILNLLDKLSRQ